MSNRKVNRAARDSYIKARRAVHRRFGRCEYILHTNRFQKFRHHLPKEVRLYIFLRWPFSKVIWCDQNSTIVAESPSKHYDKLHVCAKHNEDILLHNQLDEMIKSGELARQIREAEGNE